jgi:hypothetical protein
MRYCFGSASALCVVLTACSHMRACAFACSRLRSRPCEHQRLPGGVLQDHDGSDV